MIHEESYCSDERVEQRQLIFSNILVALRIIAEEGRDIGIEYENKSSYVSFPSLLGKGFSTNLTFLKAHEETIARTEDLGSDDPFPPDSMAAFKELLADEGIQKIIARGNQFALHDNFQ